MDSEIKNLIATRMEELPILLQNLLLKESLIEAIHIIAKKHNLPDTKIYLLENEVLLVLLAFETLDDFEERIVQELLIPGSIAASITRDLHSTLFAEVENELHEIYLDRAAYEKAFPESKATESPTQTSPQIPLITRTEETPTVTPTNAPSDAKRLSGVPRYTEDPYHEPLG